MEESLFNNIWYFKICRFLAFYRLSNKNPDRRKTNRKTETGDLFFRTLGVMKRRKTIKLASRSGSKNQPSLTYEKVLKLLKNVH